MTDAAIYDIDVYSDDKFIDEFVCAGAPPPDFDETKWIEGYKRHFPHIAANYPNITIKVKMRERK